MQVLGDQKRCRNLAFPMYLYLVPRIGGVPTPKLILKFLDECERSLEDLSIAAERPIQRRYASIKTMEDQNTPKASKNVDYYR